MAASTLLLGIDTCGPTGSVALGRWSGQAIEVLGQIELEGRNYSSTLVAAVGELLVGAGMRLGQLNAIVAAKAGVASAALDAHRHEVFLRLEAASEQAWELLAGVHELAAVDSPPARIALCDEAASVLIGEAWPAAELVSTAAPTAGDALRLCAPRVAAGESTDLALLDGHYLRRSDAEIFGEAAAPGPQRT